MRKVIFGGGSSLDNYIARADHSVDWLKWGPEAAEVTAAFWKTIDTVLMGRKTFERAPKGGYPGVTTYVFSRTLERDPPGMILVRERAARFVGELKAQPGKDICLMGGGEFARSLFEADLVDEVGFNIHPVLLGEGIPGFHPMTRRIELELKECRRFENDCVLVTYRVRRGVTS